MFRGPLPEDIHLIVIRGRGASSPMIADELRVGTVTSRQYWGLSDHPRASGEVGVWAFTLTRGRLRPARPLRSQITSNGYVGSAKNIRRCDAQKCVLPRARGVVRGRLGSARHSDGPGRRRVKGGRDRPLPVGPKIPSQNTRRGVDPTTARRPASPFFARRRVARGAEDRPSPTGRPAGPGVVRGEVDFGAVAVDVFWASTRTAAGERAPGRGPSKVLLVYVFGDAATTRPGRAGHAPPSKIRFGPNFDVRRGGRVRAPPLLPPDLRRAWGSNGHGSARPAPS